MIYRKFISAKPLKYYSPINTINQQKIQISYQKRIKKNKKKEGD